MGPREWDTFHTKTFSWYCFISIHCYRPYTFDVKAKYIRYYYDGISPSILIDWSNVHGHENGIWFCRLFDPDNRLAAYDLEASAAAWFKNHVSDGDQIQISIRLSNWSHIQYKDNKKSFTAVYIPWHCSFTLALISLNIWVKVAEISMLTTLQFISTVRMISS